MVAMPLTAPSFVGRRYRASDDRRQLIWIAVLWNEDGKTMDMLSNAYISFDKCADYCDVMNQTEREKRWKPFATNLILHD